MSRPDLPHEPLGRLVVVAGHVLSRRWSRHLAERHGLTTAGMRVLLTLGEHGELPHRDMADRCFIRPATLTGVVDTLEREGLVERRRGQTDRRRVRLALTPSGELRRAALTDLISSGTPLTSVDADPANEAVIRRFLLEVIGTMFDGERCR